MWALVCWQSKHEFLLGGASRLHVCLRNRALTCPCRAHTAIHGLKGSLKQAAEPGRNAEPEHFVCCSCPSPAVQQPVATSQVLASEDSLPGPPMTMAPLLPFPGQCHLVTVTSVLPQGEGWGPSPARGAEPHPAASSSLLAEDTPLARTSPLVAKGSTCMASWAATAQSSLCSLSLA